MAESARPAPEWQKVADAALEVARKYPDNPLAKRMIGASKNEAALRSAIFSAVVLDSEFAQELQELVGWP